MPDQPDTTRPAPERLAPTIGALVVLVAVSSLLDDAELIEHPWWVSLVIGLVAIAVALMARTAAKLVRPR